MAYLISHIDMSKNGLEESSNKGIMETKLNKSDVVSIFELVCG